MNTIIITTPENIEIEYRLAGVGARLSAAMIDMLIVGLMMSFILYLGYAAFWAFGYSGWILGGVILALFAVNTLYFIISEMAMKGQSFGKKILKLRVIRQNGQPVTFFGSLVRNLFRLFLDMFGVGTVCMFFNKHHKRIGDMTAGTVVVAENPGQIEKTQITLAALVNQGAVTAVVTPVKYALSPEEYRLLNEYFLRKDTLLDGGEALRDQWIHYFNKRFGIEPGLLNEAGLQKIMAFNRQLKEDNA